MEDSPDSDKLNRLNKLKYTLHKIEKKLPHLFKTLNWDYNNLLLGDDSSTAKCSLNQHKILGSKLKPHMRKSYLSSQAYDELEKEFPEYSGSGSCISLSLQLINSVTKNIASGVENKILRAVPESSRNFDQNFSREEKLAIYDYVIANTKKQATFSDLCSQGAGKKQEKKEMTAWEIAAAERDAKRRRASYRNKVHTNCKTHTEVLRELIKEQMDMLKPVTITKKSYEGRKRDEKCSVESNHREDKRKYDNSSKRRNEEEDRNIKLCNDHYLSKSKCNKSWREDPKCDSGCGSRCYEKYRNWKTGEGRPRFHKSSHTRTPK